jgi:hypothetical protein
MSNLAILAGVVVVDDEADAVGADGFDGAADAADDDTDGFPLIWPAFAGTDPKDFTPSALIAGVAAGDEDIGAETAETSSVVPKVKPDPSRCERKSCK